MDVMVTQWKDKSNSSFRSFLNFVGHWYEISTSFLGHLIAVKNLERDTSGNF